MKPRWAWVLDVLAITVGVVLAEIVIQLVITPTISAQMAGKSNAAKPAGDAQLPW